MDYKFKVGDTGKTSNGEYFRILCTDLGGSRFAPLGAIVAAITSKSGEGEFVATYLPSGEPVVPQLGNLLPPRQKRKVWVNVYDGGYSVYSSKEIADGYTVKRIACVEVEIEFTPGEGL